MYRVAKPKGIQNIVVEEVAVPEVAATEVPIRAETSLISRESEIWRRYVHEEAIGPQIMGYSMVGSIVEVGSKVRWLLSRPASGRAGSTCRVCRGRNFRFRPSADSGRPADEVTIRIRNLLATGDKLDHVDGSA